jgi:tRNA (mo5U34)-methyltransferase
MTRDEKITILKQKINNIKWHHSIELEKGVITPGGDNSFKKLKKIKLPESLAGQTVLDVGAWDGFFSFEAEKRQAKRVLATDSFVWREFGKEGFDLSKDYLKSDVEEMVIDVLELSPEKVGEWDIVLFLGVLYHMQHPLLSLQKVASVTKKMLIVETLVDMLMCKRPAMAFYQGGEMSNDSTNWVGPNPEAVIAMLKTVGFTKVEVVSGVRSFLFRICKSAWYKYKYNYPFWSSVRTDRIVVHAWK